MYDNKITQIRPSSTFDAFEVYDEGQQEVVDTMRRIADGVVSMANAVANQEYPFPHGQVIFIWSEPGHGKSHLLEGLAHSIISRKPGLVSRIGLARGNFTHRQVAAPYDYGGLPIVLIDDLFAEYQSLAKLSHVDLRCLMDYLALVYERRTLVVATSNFPMMAGGGIISRIAEQDKIGRTLSRCKELLSTAGEIYLPGNDFRETIAARRKAGGTARRNLRLNFTGEE